VGVENLIFPAPQDENQLEKLAEAGIPNVLLLRVPEGKDPRKLGEAALEAARDCLLDRAK
jgi:CRISPR-associated protein Cmr2